MCPFLSVDSECDVLEKILARAGSPRLCYQSAVLERLIRNGGSFASVILGRWPTDPFVATPNVIDDHVNKLRGDRFAHRRKEPLESSMWVSRWVEVVAEGEEVGEGFRCGCRLFLHGIRGLEYEPLRFVGSGQEGSECADVTLVTSSLHAAWCLGDVEEISIENGDGEDLFCGGWVRSD